MPVQSLRSNQAAKPSYFAGSGRRLGDGSVVEPPVTPEELSPCKAVVDSLRIAPKRKRTAHQKYRTLKNVKPPKKPRIDFNDREYEPEPDVESDDDEGDYGRRTIARAAKKLKRAAALGVDVDELKDVETTIGTHDDESACVEDECITQKDEQGLVLMDKRTGEGHGSKESARVANEAVMPYDGQSLVHMDESVGKYDNGDEEINDEGKEPNSIENDQQSLVVAQL